MIFCGTRRREAVQVDRRGQIGVSLKSIRLLRAPGLEMAAQAQHRQSGRRDSPAQHRRSMLEKHVYVRRRGGGPEGRSRAIHKTIAGYV